MFNKFLFLIIIIGLAFVFTTNSFGQDNKKTLSKPSKIKQAKKGVAEWTDILARKNNKGKTNPKSVIGNSQKTKRINRKNPTQVTGGTIPVYKNGKSSAKRKRTPVKNSFESQTQPFADGKVKGKNEPEAKPALLEFQIPEKIVSDNKHPEGQYSRKEADSRKSNPKPKRTNVKKSNGITILDQDTQTVVAPRKRKRNK